MKTHLKLTVRKLPLSKLQPHPQNPRTHPPPGYMGTAFSRLTLQQKLAVGAKPEDILRKELSLAGYQRPLDPRTLPPSARTFFQLGEFAGWIIEAPEG